MLNNLFKGKKNNNNSNIICDNGTISDILIKRKTISVYCLKTIIFKLYYSTEIKFLDFEFKRDNISNNSKR